MGHLSPASFASLPNGSTGASALVFLAAKTEPARPVVCVAPAELDADFVQPRFQCAVEFVIRGGQGVGQLLDPAEKMEDIRCAIDYLTTLPIVDQDRTYSVMRCLSERRT
jgi:hypothetical protein